MKLSECVAAFERGEIVQWEGKPGVWADKLDNSWDSRYNYRLKPKLLEYWANVYRLDSVHFHLTREAAIQYASHEAVRIAVHMVEAPNETK